MHRTLNINALKRNASKFPGKLRQEKKIEKKEKGKRKIKRGNFNLNLVFLFLW